MREGTKEAGEELMSAVYQELLKLAAHEIANAPRPETATDRPGASGLAAATVLSIHG
jgi:hypothetical protein